MAKAQPDQAVFDGLVADIQKQRSDAKLNKNTILRRGLANYARYGASSPFTNILSMRELQSMDINHLLSKIHSLTSYEHRIFYRGPEHNEHLL